MRKSRLQRFITTSQFKGLSIFKYLGLTWSYWSIIFKKASIYFILFLSDKKQKVVRGKYSWLEIKNTTFFFSNFKNVIVIANSMLNCCLKC
jgi:hypothetical protein